MNTDHQTNSDSDGLEERSGTARPQRPAGQRNVTQVLADVQSGSIGATDELFPIVYDELRALAAKFLNDESNAQTLQPTALVHEAYLRLIGPANTPWENRAHFFGAAAKAIRRILIDHARTKCRQKRSSGGKRIALEDNMVVSTQEPERLVQFDDALLKLAAIDPQKARVVELRFFAGMTADQTAMAMGISPSTVARDWQFARVWLFDELSKTGVDGSKEGGAE